jgi:peptidyl-prolyl cis-trans isomerase C/peptidyl-prolyl cis-trans isomerase D
MKKQSRSENHFRRFASLAVILAASGLLSAKAIAAATELARVNGTVITLQDFEARYKQSLTFFQAKPPTRKNVLDEIIKREIGIQQAKKMGLDKDPAVVDQIDNVLFQAYLTKKLSKQFDAIHVTDEEAKDFYANNPEIRTSHIFVAVRPDAKPEEVKDAKAKIEELQKKLDSGMGFAEVAQKFSEGQVAAQGGDIGWQTRNGMDPAYYAAAKRLSVGHVSPIVRSQFGFHIIKLTGKRSWDDVDRPMIKRIVFDDRRQAIYDQFMNQLRSQASVVVHSELLKN